MRGLTRLEIIELCIIHKLARSAKYLGLANAVFLRLLIEAVAHHNEWKIFWIANKKARFNLIGIQPNDSDVWSFVVPTLVLPAQILREAVADALFRACEADGAIVQRKKRGGGLPRESISSVNLDRIWNIFLRIIPPEEAIALVQHNFVNPNAAEIIDEIEQRIRFNIVQNM